MTNNQKKALTAHYYNTVMSSERTHELIYNPVVLGKTFEQAVTDLDHNRLNEILQVRKDLLLLDESIEELKAKFIEEQKRLLDQREEKLKERRLELLGKLSSVKWEDVPLGNLEVAWSAASSRR